jgi:hypothetical protein
MLRITGLIRPSPKQCFRTMYVESKGARVYAHGPLDPNKDPNKDPNGGPGSTTGHKGKAARGQIPSQVANCSRRD